MHRGEGSSLVVIRCLVLSVMGSPGQGKLLCCLLLLLGMCLCCSASDLTLGDVFPFGTGQGDSELPTGNDVTVEVLLDTPTQFFGESRSSIRVSFVKYMKCGCMGEHGPVRL